MLPGEKAKFEIDTALPEAAGAGAGEGAGFPYPRQDMPADKAIRRSKAATIDVFLMVNLLCILRSFSDARHAPRGAYHQHRDASGA